VCANGVTGGGFSADILSPKFVVFDNFDRVAGVVVGVVAGVVAGVVVGVVAGVVVVGVVVGVVVVVVGVVVGVAGMLLSFLFDGVVAGASGVFGSFPTGFLTFLFLLLLSIRDNWLTACIPCRPIPSNSIILFICYRNLVYVKIFIY
jgi:hypothetical protein